MHDETAPNEHIGHEVVSQVLDETRETEVVLAVILRGWYVDAGRDVVEVVLER